MACCFAEPLPEGPSAVRHIVAWRPDWKSWRLHASTPPREGLALQASQSNDTWRLLPYLAALGAADARRLCTVLSQLHFAAENGQTRAVEKILTRVAVNARDEARLPASAGSRRGEEPRLRASGRA